MGIVVVECTALGSSRVRISVRDTGAGLGREQIDALFQPFNRLGQEAGAEEGTGIGLVVTKRLVELMQGEIGVTSTVGIGSLFWIELNATDPVAAAPAELETPRPARAMQAPGALRTVLYVEDNPANLRLVEDIMRFHAEFQLLSALDGAQGIALARQHRPDVILMDMNLPGISGAEAQRVLRADPDTANIPVIALTANAMPRDVRAGIAAGFFRYITKPIDIDELLDAIDGALGTPRKEP